MLSFYLELVQYQSPTLVLQEQVIHPDRQAWAIRGRRIRPRNLDRRLFLTW